MRAAERKRNEGLAGNPERKKEKKGKQAKSPTSTTPRNLTSLSLFSHLALPGGILPDQPALEAATWGRGEGMTPRCFPFLPSASLLQRGRGLLPPSSGDCSLEEELRDVGSHEVEGPSESSS